VCDTAGGFCPPIPAPIIGATVIAADAGTAAAPGAVYFVDSGGLAQFAFPTGSMSPHFALTGAGGTTVSCLGAGANSAFVCKDDPSTSTIGPTSYIQQVTPIPPDATATIYPRADVRSPPGFAIGAGSVAVGPLGHAWWIDGFGSNLFGVWEPTNGVTQMTGWPVGAWRAVAADPLTGDGYVADDASGGRIQRLNDSMTFNDSVSLVATGAGSVGAIAVRNGGPATEVYWADLASGSVILQVNGVRRTIFRGSGPTGRMRLAANAEGVYWIDRDARQVWGYMPSKYGLVPLMTGLSVLDVAAGPGWVFWLGADGRVFGVTP
jgi:hypothetical protein